MDILKNIRETALTHPKRCAAGYLHSGKPGG